MPSKLTKTSEPRCPTIQKPLKKQSTVPQHCPKYVTDEKTKKNNRSTVRTTFQVHHNGLEPMQRWPIGSIHSHLLAWTDLCHESDLDTRLHWDNQIGYCTFTQTSNG
eukprot:2926668-Amphidinium_carterae.1